MTTYSGWRATFSPLLKLPAGKIGAGLSAFVVVVAVAGPWLTSIDPFALSGAPLLPPSTSHWFGTDALGRDLFSGMLYGARTSTTIALGVSAVSFVCGMTVGLVSAYCGGWIDTLLTRITELLQVLPKFFLVIVAAALFGPGIDKLILILGFTSWPVLARVVRGEVLSLRQAEFVLAAYASGASTSQILRRAIMPNVAPHAIVVTGLLLGQVLLIEASLGFLGLGDPNAISWGTLAGQSQPFQTPSSYESGHSNLEWFHRPP